MGRGSGWQEPPSTKAHGPSDISVCPRLGPKAHPPIPYLKLGVHLHQQSLWHWGVGVGAHLS